MGSHVTLRWTESIAQKVKRKKKVEDNSRKEIWHSVFAPQIDPVPSDELIVRGPKSLGSPWLVLSRVITCR